MMIPFVILLLNGCVSKGYLTSYCEIYQTIEFESMEEIANTSINLTSQIVRENSKEEKLCR